MRSRNFALIAGTVLVACSQQAPSGSSPTATAATDPQPVIVTESNFNQAESDLYFRQSVRLAGGIGKFHHIREIMPIDHQTVIRANRDTLYSSAVFDLDAGPVTVTLPDPGKRFMSMIALDEEQYALGTVYAPGTFSYSRDQVGTRYLMLGLRTFVDPNDQQDLEKTHALQDAVKIVQKSPGAFDAPTWDPKTQKVVREELIKRAAQLPDTKGMFGPRGDVDPERHLIGTATGWGGNAPGDALYLTVVPAKNDGSTVYKMVIPPQVPVDGFWSVSVYGTDGYFAKNPLNSYSINNITAKKGPDGSITVQFGGCGGAVPNCIPTSNGWNYWVRLYRPRAEVLNGQWKFPEARPL